MTNNYNNGVKTEENDYELLNTKRNNVFYLAVNDEIINFAAK